MKPDILEKYRKLKEIISGFKTAIVAYSGGLDSAFLLYACVDTLGPEAVTAVTADSESYPRSELEKACKFAESLGLKDRHRIIKTREIEDPNYAANPLDRCFFCKQELYGRLTDTTVFNKAEVVFDGFNADDVGDFRPGRKAAEKYAIRSPLFEAGLGKAEIRELAKHIGLSIWDKPQSACLASRIPYGSPVTKDKLEQIETAEEFLRGLGFKQLRVRHHDILARIELPREDIDTILTADLREKIYAKFRELGFVWVTLDLAGFRSGSMNEALDRSDKDV
jgi:uncharacterized protein